MLPEKDQCRVCGSETTEVGVKIGVFRPDRFEFRRCSSCGYAFVQNPWTDYAEVYSEAYYRGEGADPLVDYAFELAHPEKTIRQYEWRGILTAIRSLIPVNSATRWLDFGCGNGGLVRYCRAETGCEIVGFEEGWIRDQGVARGIPYLARTDLDTLAGSFDIITAIEVIEHVPDPLSFLRQVRRLLKPNGLFFLTTGNAEPHRDRMLTWGYTVPEIHVSYFEPRTLELALTTTGFRPQSGRFIPGFADIIRFKVLKNLRFSQRRFVERVLPWGVLSRIVDTKHRVSAHPIGWAA